LNNILYFTYSAILLYLEEKTEHSRHGYYWTEFFFCGLGFTSVILTIWILIENKKMGNILGKVIK